MNFFGLFKKPDPKRWALTVEDLVELRKLEEKAHAREKYHAVMPMLKNDAMELGDIRARIAELKTRNDYKLAEDKTITSAI